MRNTSSNPKSITVQFRIEEDLLNAVDDYCRKRERARSWLIRHALDAVMEKDKKRQDKILDLLK